MITTAEQWAAALDSERPDIGEALSSGSAAGVPLAHDRDDDGGRVLVSADHSMAVRYIDQPDWWEPMDPESVPERSEA